MALDAAARIPPRQAGRLCGRAGRRSALPLDGIDPMYEYMREWRRWITVEVFLGNSRPDLGSFARCGVDA